MTVRLHRSEAIGALAIIGLLVFGVGAYLLGRANSPLDRSGHPLLLTPSLVWTQQYRAQVGQWAAALRSVDKQARGTLGAQTDLYQAASAADALISDVESVESDISLSSAPPALDGLRTTALATASAYHDAAVRIGNFVAEPNTALEADAANSLSTAQAYLAALSASPWLR